MQKHIAKLATILENKTNNQLTLWLHNYDDKNISSSMVSLCKILLIWGSYTTIYAICGLYKTMYGSVCQASRRFKSFSQRQSSLSRKNALFVSKTAKGYQPFVRCTTGQEIFLRVFSKVLTPYCASGPSNKDICTILHRLLVSAVCSASSPPLSSSPSAMCSSKN